jgi:hypothetical protein
MKRFLCYAGVVSLAGAALSMAGPLASAASTSPATVYVSPADVGGAADWSCGTAPFSSIQAAVEVTPLHGPGLYQTSATVDRVVNLHGKRGAVVNAKGQPYGIGVGSPNDGIVTAGFVK